MDARLLGEIELVSAAYDVGPTKTAGTATSTRTSETILAPIDAQGVRVPKRECFGQ